MERCCQLLCHSTVAALTDRYFTSETPASVIRAGEIHRRVSTTSAPACDYTGPAWVVVVRGGEDGYFMVAIHTTTVTVAPSLSYSTEKSSYLDTGYLDTYIYGAWQL